MPPPDYQRIADLERELGIGNHQPDKDAPQPPTVCLIKDCSGSDAELCTWSGILLRRTHEH